MLCLCSTPLRFFAYLCLCIAEVSLAYLCHGKASLHSAFPSPCPSSRSTAIPLRLVTTLYAAIAAHRTHRTAFALHSRAARICSTPLRCLAAHTTPSLAFAPRCTAVTTCAPAEQTCQHNAVAELCAHIRAFEKLLQAIQRLCKSYHCRSRSNPIHAMPLLSR